jgi:hypothetical protein
MTGPQPQQPYGGQQPYPGSGPYPQQPYPQQQPYPGQQPYAQPPQQFPPHQQFPQQPQFPQGFQQPGGQPIVIPIEGKGVAKLAGRMQKRTLTISQEGFAYQDNKQQSFRIAWPELRQITITTAYHQKSTLLVAQKIWRVRVIWDAADPSFVQRHPEVGGLHGKYGASGMGSYGLPLGPVYNLVQPLAQALSGYAGPIFGGVIDEGQVLGFSYL